MYTKEQLEKLAIPELMEIANQLGVKVSQDDTMEHVIYEILDKAAIDSSLGSSTAKRKRTRIAKKDTDKVYTVSGKEGENLDAKNQKSKTVEAPSLFADQPLMEETPEVVEEEKPAPKRRGRKTKAEVAAEAEEQKKEEEVAQAAAIPEEQPLEVDAVPEANAEMMGADEPDAEMLEQLQEKMSQRQNVDAMDMMEDNNVWEGDPGDGTDFITVVDLPIEDQAAIPTLDIFDRPVVQQADPIYQANVQPSTPDYDFADLISGTATGWLRIPSFKRLQLPVIARRYLCFTTANQKV